MIGCNMVVNRGFVSLLLLSITANGASDARISMLYSLMKTRSVYQDVSSPPSRAVSTVVSLLNQSFASSSEII